jgi:hypothetical protein
MRITSLIFISVLFCYELPWQSVSVGVMGNNTNSATFNNNNILYGLDMLNFSFNMEELSNDGDEEVSISATILMPKIGYKYNMRSKNMLSTYYIGELYTVIPIISIDTGDSEANDELDDFTSDMQDTADLLGLKLSYGIKYDFNEQLSISADTGFNFLLNNFELGDVDIKARIGNTFTKLSINFTF